MLLSDKMLLYCIIVVNVTEIQNKRKKYLEEKWGDGSAREER
jgi:hypothetical protein